jgi:hypothetical protein
MAEISNLLLELPLELQAIILIYLDNNEVERIMASFQLSQKIHEHMIALNMTAYLSQYKDIIYKYGIEGYYSLDFIKSIEGSNLANYNSVQGYMSLYYGAYVIATNKTFIYSTIYSRVSLMGKQVTISNSWKDKYKEDPSIVRHIGYKDLHILFEIFFKLSFPAEYEKLKNYKSGIDWNILYTNIILYSLHNKDYLSRNKKYFIAYNNGQRQSFGSDGYCSYEHHCPCKLLICILLCDVKVHPDKWKEFPELIYLTDAYPT